MKVFTVPRFALLSGRVDADAVISIREGNEANPLDVPGKFGNRVLHLCFDDLSLPHPPGLIGARFKDVIFPDADDVFKAIGFARRIRAELGDKASLACQCAAGVSRSGAIAYVILADQHKDPHVAVERLLEDSPGVLPNQLIVALADKILSRKGALTRALKDAMPGWGLAPKDEASMRAHFGLDKPMSWNTAIRGMQAGVLGR